MTETIPTLRLWFMDWHGWMLDHNPLTDTFSHNPFQPGRLPGLNAVVPVPFQLPCHPVMEKRISMPRPFPELEMQELSHNQVIFLVPKTGTYLRSVPSGQNRVDYAAPAPQAWETFFPMTIEMLRGLSLILTAHHAIRLENEAQDLLPLPTLHEGFILRFEDKDLPLFLNTAALKQIGQLMPGNSAPVSLTWQIDTPPVSFVAHREAATEPATV
ncbi:hypothetical protein [Gluconobacter roseus]|uniref:Uncharacterized protein n=2 Tax=Gluconobacter roseus TaxID=586239 RepID=A0A4Y3M5Z5_9PROT|nr:hypothetical protein [Gluconobacter roseus]GBR49678.1 hypothetical protein AA3990_2606 [Gluconobacter roseus NBRC 3990]GEB04024.1 hypothetical protein GRO01_16000 [Gluconobacter roseus NBRC 3990]GLP92469.1 hypothetical protein GCM10007871_04470 [Gluconobacter roseus NBRC 3990]